MQANVAKVTLNPQCSVICERLDILPYRLRSAEFCNVGLGCLFLYMLYVPNNNNSSAMSQSSTYAFNSLWLIAPRCLQDMQWHGSTAECILTLRISQGLPWLTESSRNEHASMCSSALHLHMLRTFSLHRRSQVPGTSKITYYSTPLSAIPSQGTDSILRYLSFLNVP